MHGPRELAGVDVRDQRVLTIAERRETGARADLHLAVPRALLAERGQRGSRNEYGRAVIAGPVDTVPRQPVAVGGRKLEPAVLARDVHARENRQRVVSARARDHARNRVRERLRVNQAGELGHGRQRRIPGRRLRIEPRERGHDPLALDNERVIGDGDLSGNRLAARQRLNRRDELGARDQDLARPARLARDFGACRGLVVERRQFQRPARDRDAHARQDGNARPAGQAERGERERVAQLGAVNGDGASLTHDRIYLPSLDDAFRSGPHLGCNPRWGHGKRAMPP